MSRLEDASGGDLNRAAAARQRNDKKTMPTATYIEPDGTPHETEAAVGQSLMQNAVDHGVPGILGDCGGECSCATCHAYVDEAWLALLPERSRDEAQLLAGVIDPAPNSRLTCQLRMREEWDGIVLHLPPSQY